MLNLRNVLMGLSTWWLLGVGSCLGVTTLTGCASTPYDAAQSSQSHSQMLDSLRTGQANGQLKMHAGGRLLSVGATNEFFFGPAGTFEFEGSVDFREPTSTQP